MTVKEVHDLLESNRNERGIENWNKMNHGSMTAYGLGLTQLKKLAKTIGRNKDLAKDLWKEDNFDCKNLALLIEEPKKMNESDIQKYIQDISMWMLSHTFVQNVFSKTKFNTELAETCRKSEDDLKRRCGYANLYYSAKTDKKNDDTYYENIIDYIEAHLQGEENFVKDAMNNALFTIGKRNDHLKAKVIQAAKKIGPVMVDYGDNSCQALDLLKHLDKGG